MRLLAIDPGQQYGWAFWKRQPCPKEVGVGRLDRVLQGRRWLDRCMLVAWEINRLAEELNPGTVVIERPDFTGVSRHEDVGKLQFLIGAITITLIDHGLTVRLVGVNEWKGQLTKKIVERRVEKRMREAGVLERYLKLGARKDAIDAVGIGLFHVGSF